MKRETPDAEDLVRHVREALTTTAAQQAAAGLVDGLIAAPVVTQAVANLGRALMAEAETRRVLEKLFRVG